MYYCACACPTPQVFAILGFLSPAHRGGLLTALLLLYVLNGFFGGYVAARVYKMFDGQTPTRTTLFTAVSFPSLVFSIAFVINLFVWHQVCVLWRAAVSQVPCGIHPLTSCASLP